MADEPAGDSGLVKLKYYATLTLGLTACLSCFTFFFMIPFILDPSVSTIVADFVPYAVVCKTVLTEHLYGMKNCSWSSCKQGCTVDQYECDQIFVNYMHKKFDEFEGNEYYEDDDDIWVVKGVPVFVNIKGCGYPPTTNCSIYGDEFGPVGTIFPCYYSRARPSLVISDYSWEGAVHPMIMALILPNLITGVSLGLLSYWWYPGCQKKENSYQIPPDQQSHHEEDEEDGVGNGSQGSEDEGGGTVSGSKEKPSSEATVDLLTADVSSQKDCKVGIESNK